MKSVYEAQTRQELISRINAITSQNKAEWGTMNLPQMLRHCRMAEEMLHGKIKIKRVLPGYLFGKMVLKKVLKDDSPFGKNSPTSSKLKTSDESGDIEQLKKDWIKQVEQYGNFINSDFVHPFFGPMTKEQIGHFAYKHADHHLRQFGA